MPDFSHLWFWPFVTAFIMLVAAGFGAPIPEELPTIGAGIWVAGSADIGPVRWLILPICFLGVMISDVLLFGIGRMFGPKLLEWTWVKRFYPVETRLRTEENFHRYGLRLLLFMRWVPAIRSPMFITAGLMRLPLHRFILADGIALVFGHSLLFFLAYWFGEQFLSLVKQAETLEAALKPILVLTVIGIVAAFFLYHFFKHPVATGDPDEIKDLPIVGEKVAGRLSSPEYIPEADTSATEAAAVSADAEEPPESRNPNG